MSDTDFFPPFVRSLPQIDLPLPGVTGWLIQGRDSQVVFVEFLETVEVPESLLAGGNNFALQVQGESMVDEGIRDGDVLIIRKQDHADNGQTVVAQIEGEATIKKFYQRDGRVELRPANEEVKPLVVPAEKVEIIGVVIGLFRHYKR